ncbi:hypothetical protein HanPI659440_Chr08g0306411 [Helianthus annuus]|nr:hypothetical protein HanPI659440_Chr08g0306411 [Helianthus annuus]
MAIRSFSLYVKRPNPHPFFSCHFKPFGSRCGKTNLWMKVAKLAKPQGRKWHFTLKKMTQKVHKTIS